MPKTSIHLLVNGERHTLTVWPMSRLLDAIREDLRLTGTKEGCGEGECGACSILLNGQLVNSCLVPALQADGAEVTTIEGIAARVEFDGLRQAFLECGAAQCGICTPGMMMAAVSLLAQQPHPSEVEISRALAGNLCRCTGYLGIFEAVTRASAQNMPTGKA
jgi:aerobic carbon-monoxide dehydrogenase small subunit